MQLQLLQRVTLSPATRCDEMGYFPVILSVRSIADHCKYLQKKLQQCGQSATHNGMFEHSPAMFIAAMVIRNI